MRDDDEGEKITVPLPPGVIIRENSMLGYEFIEEGNPKPITYHPKDNDSIRLLVWQIWRRRHEV